jgi:hypothetical protein
MSEDKIRVTWEDVTSDQTDESNLSSAEKSNAPPVRNRTAAKYVVMTGGLFLVLCAVVAAMVLWPTNGNVRGQAGSIKQIERVLKEDSACSQGAQTTSEVVARMRRIDTSGCPKDFRTAYLAHIHAWELMADIEQQAVTLKAESESVATFVESFIRGFLGDPLGKANEIGEAQGQLARDCRSASTQVRLTYQRVEEIAVSHGATLPSR